MPASLRIEIFVSSLQRTISFYSGTLAFKLLKRDGNYAYLGRDDIFIGVIEAPSEDPVEARMQYLRPTKGIEIVIEVDDLENERDTIVARGHQLEEDIKLQEWGLRDFRMTDPDGYYLRFTTHSPRRDGKGAENRL